MDPEDFFRVADSIVRIKQKTCSEEILFRSAINRLYYGIFHFIQKKLGIIIPDSEIHRCHAYIKEKIEETNIRSDYMDLEEFRVHADYHLSAPINRKDFEDTLKLKNRLVRIIKEGSISFMADEDEFFFEKFKAKRRKKSR